MYYLIKYKCKEEQNKEKIIQGSTAHFQDSNFITANSSCLKTPWGQGKNCRYQFISVTEPVIRLMFVSWYYSLSFPH